MNKIFFKSILPLVAVLVMFVIGCKDDPVTPETKDAIASFQYEISTTDFLEVSFSNFSQNATSYSWDFGDGNSSTEESPTHNYATAGEYTVVLTATGDNAATKSETFTLTNPNAAAELLTGPDSKTWHLQREGIALGIGPAAGDNEYWSFGGVTPLGERPCILDDSFTFNSDGSAVFNTGGTVFIDSDGNGGWLPVGEPEGCHDETEAGILTSRDGDDLSAFANGGNYTFEYDAAAGSLTVLGEGAYIGLPNKTADGDNFIPTSSKTYTIFKIAEGAVADTLQLALVGGASWNFYLVSYHNPNDLPDIPEVVIVDNDLPNETPSQLFNTFASDGAADVQELVPTASEVTLTIGVDDPADPAATKVGEFVRGTTPFSDLKFQLAYDCQFDNFTSMSIDVYFPSSNDYSGALSQQVDIFIADASEDGEFWTTWELYQDITQTAQDEWVTLTFNLGNALTREDLDMIGLKIGGENHDIDGKFYIRNFTFK